MSFAHFKRQDKLKTAERARYGFPAFFIDVINNTRKLVLHFSKVMYRETAAGLGKYGYGNGIAVMERISGTVLKGIFSDYTYKITINFFN